MTSAKKELKQKENRERLASAISGLDSITKNNNIQRNIRNMVREVLMTLKDEKGGSISVRAANAISISVFFNGFRGGGSFSSLWLGLAR